MCGIAGYCGEGTREILGRMNDVIRHRGPDAEGLYVAPGIGLAHRRLSIIDLSPAGHQPMSNEAGDIWIVFNGEIYNFEELRRGLLGRHEFRGSSDTEVIIHLYEEIGTKVFSRIQGMFALALYDKRTGTLILARDRLGKKPLYWSVRNGTLVFGSELKALMPHPNFRKELNLSALNKYLLYEYVPTPHTIFSEVYKLEPGHFLEFDGKEVSRTCFWDVPILHDPPPSLPEAVAELDRRLEHAVVSRLMSDVPLGIFLSGGLDSSTVAYYAQKHSTQKIKTFAIGFHEKSFDESAFARQVADHLGTDHYEHILGAKDALELVPRAAELMDEPLADASLIPTYLLSTFTREHVTVALGGDGGDELLMGYDTFLSHRLGFLWQHIPRLLRAGVLHPLIRALPTSFDNLTWEFKAKKFIAGFDPVPAYRNQRWLGAFDRRARAALFVPEVWRELAPQPIFEDIDRLRARVPHATVWQELTYIYLRTYMMDDILVKVDRASMFNALEVRAPFLDTAVVEFLFNLPRTYKLRGLHGKFLLKQLMRDRLPTNIVYRAKKGFGLPVSEWLTKDLRPLLEEYLNRERLVREGLFNPAYVERLIHEHTTRRVDHRKLLWTLLMFELWRERWMV